MSMRQVKKLHPGDQVTGSNAMKIELKRISHSARLSQETEAFAADLWIDGRKAGSAENDGHGGSTIIRIDDHELCAKADAYANGLPPIVYPEPNGFTVPMDLEHLVDNLLADHLQTRDEQRQYKRWCKKATMFRLKGDKPGEWRTLKGGPFSPAAKAWLVNKYGDTIETILNETI